MEEDIGDDQGAGASVPVAAPITARGGQEAPEGTETHEPECASRAVNVAQDRESGGVTRTPEARIPTQRADSPIDCHADPIPPGNSPHG